MRCHHCSKPSLLSDSATVPLLFIVHTCGAYDGRSRRATLLRVRHPPNLASCLLIIYAEQLGRKCKCVVPSSSTSSKLLRGIPRLARSSFLPITLNGLPLIQRCWRTFHQQRDARTQAGRTYRVGNPPFHRQSRTPRKANREKSFVALLVSVRQQWSRCNALRCRDH